VFRREVIEHRSERLSGEVVIAVPLGWQVIGYLTLAILGMGIAFLATARYARVETSIGTIVPDLGVADVVPSRSGVVATLSVTEGQMVAAGQTLAEIRVEEDSAGAVSSGAQVSAELARQDRSLSDQGAAATAETAALANQAAAKRAGLVREIDQLLAQMALQQNLIDLARQDLDRARIVAERGFVSANDVRARETTLISRQQVFAQLQQARSTRQSELLESQRSQAQLAAQAQERLAGLAASRAAVAQAVATTQGARSYALRAPVAGRVTGLVARLGKHTAAGEPVLQVVPQGATLRAELRLPSAAIGFVRPGQPVQLAIDAFPYQRFGTIQGKILTVGTAALPTKLQDPAAQPAYPVIVRLRSDRIAAFGRQERLLPGMQVTARITTEQRTLLQWLFEPLFAVGRR
jgi:membrane fusion protein